MSLRPLTLEEFINQTEAKRELEDIIQSSRIRDELPEHMLFYGPAGVGKTTLAYIISHELRCPFNETTGGAVEDEVGLVQIMSPACGGVLFIDEIHRLKPAIQERLHSVLEDGVYHPSRNLESFKVCICFIGATTKLALLNKPFRDRFPISIRLNPYPIEDMNKIGRINTKKLGLDLSDDALEKVSISSRGIPRILNNLLLRIRDNQTANGIIGEETTGEEIQTFLEALPDKYDKFGLTRLDRQILATLAESGKPMGLRNLAFSVDEDVSTIEEVLEPFLLQSGYVQRTSRGRTITPKGITVINPSNSTSLF